MADVIVGMPLARRLEGALQKAAVKVAPETGRQLLEVLNPQSLAIMAGVITAWIAAHAIGLGEIIDIVIVVAGVAAIGLAFFSGIDELYEFAVGVYRASTDSQLDRAADHLAKAIGILGVQIVLAILFRGAKMPITGRGPRFNVGRPPRTPGWRYRPTVTHDPTLPAGEGATSIWGDIEVSTRGTAADRSLVLLHERVHQFLSPKLYILREYRAGNLSASYVRSSLWRYLEEALAETFSQISVYGLTKIHIGIKFPVQNGYMFLTTGGGFEAVFAGSGAIPEGAALVYQGLVMGFVVQVRILPCAKAPAGSISKR